MFQKLMLAFICIIFGCSAFSFASDDSLEAEGLTEQAWHTLWPATAPNKEALKEKEPAAPRINYGGTCDAPEVAASLFEKAASLDQSSVKIWLGWGRALERLALCPAGSEYSWMEMRLGLNIHENNIRPRRNPPRATEMVKKAYGAAAEKFARAAELEPDNVDVLQSWGQNLMKRAKAETKVEPSRLLAEEAFEKYARLASLHPDSARDLEKWGQAMLEYIPYEPEEVLWKKLLSEAEDKIWRAFKMKGALNAGQNNKILEESQRAVDAYQNVINNCGDHEKDKTKVLLTSILEKMSPYELEKRDSDERLFVNQAYYYYSALGELYLSLSLVEADEKQWRQSLEKAKEKFESANQNESKYSGRSDWYAMLIRTAEKEKNPHRRQLMLEEALAIMDKMELPSWKVSDESGSMLNPKALSLASRYMMASYMLPMGEKRDRALKKAGIIFANGLEETKDDEFLPNLVKSTWGQVILKQSEYSDDPAYIKTVMATSEEKFSLLRYSSSSPNEFLHNYSSALNRSAEAVKNPEIRKIYWLEIIKAFEKYGVNDSQLIYDKFIMYDILINAHLNLALLGDLDNVNGDASMMHLINALMIYPDKMTSPKAVKAPYFFPMGWEDKQIDLAHILMWAEGHLKDRNMASWALMIYRDYFNSFPEEQEGQNLFNRFPSSPPNKSSHTFQDAWSAGIAYKMQGIHQALLGQDLGDWGEIQLAGLYRFLVASKFLSKEYRELYFQRAAAYYRAVLAREKEIPTEAESGGPDGQPDFAKKQDALNRAYECSLARSELGLLLAEEALANDPKASWPEEAEKLWAEAEQILPGSSRYARARLAAWRGEKAEMIEYLRHGPDEARLLIYPSFDEARQDPAFADFRDSEWFRQVWYGLR